MDQAFLKVFRIKLEDYLFAILVFGPCQTDLLVRQRKAEVSRILYNRNITIKISKSQLTISWYFHSQNFFHKLTNVDGVSSRTEPPEILLLVIVHTILACQTLFGQTSTLVCIGDEALRKWKKGVGSEFLRTPVPIHANCKVLGLTAVEGRRQSWSLHILTWTSWSIRETWRLLRRPIVCLESLVSWWIREKIESSLSHMSCRVLHLMWQFKSEYEWC